MNILVVGKFYVEGFALHISETLRGMGHSVRRFEPGFKSASGGGTVSHRLDQVRGLLHAATDSLPAIRRHRMRALWSALDAGPIDLAIVCHDFLLPGEVVELKRRTGAKIALWFPDALVNFGKGYFMNAPYDALFFKDPYIVARLAGVLESPVFYLPECFNPAKHRLPGGKIETRFACDIATAGNSHSWRVALFRHLSGYDVKLWGPPAPLWMPLGRVGMMHQGSVVRDEQKAAAFLGAKIVLNNLHYGEIWGLNARAFEAAGVGAFQLIDWRPGLEQLFEEGAEVVSFRGMRDLLEKIDYWLPRDEERRAIGAAAKRRALAAHTYRHRLDLLLSTLAGAGRGYPLPTGAANL